jgi:hypothetical protein
MAEGRSVIEHIEIEGFKSCLQLRFSHTTSGQSLSYSISYAPYLWRSAIRDITCVADEKIYEVGENDALGIQARPSRTGTEHSAEFSSRSEPLAASVMAQI